MKNKKPEHPAEQADGDYAAQHKDRKFEKKVRTKTGEDGVEETHVTYTDRSTKKYFTP